ncbi:MAG: hypothetical protein WDN00_08600 [Limisphaerales bacterium]
MLDTVTSLGGCPVRIDDWKRGRSLQRHPKMPERDARIITNSFSPRAMEVATKRKTKVQSWYLDVNLLSSYWGQERVYHHTAPITMNYGLHEALRLVLEEGLENRWARHEQNHLLLKKGLAELGLEIASQHGHQLWQLNTVTVPAGVDELAVRKQLLTDYNIEVGAGSARSKEKSGASA